MHFLLFIPGSHGADPSLLESVGLDSLRDGAAFTPIDAGPTGEGGNLVTWSTPWRHCPATFDTDLQEWVPAVPLNGRAAGRYWVGFWKQSPPRPDDLLRADVQGGVSALLGDNQIWELPRAWDLPADMVRGESGLYELCIQRRFTEFMVAVNAWMLRFALDDAGRAFNWSDLCEFVEMALGINYRLTSEVIAYLHLFQQGKSERMFEAALRIVSVARLEG